MTGTAAPFVLGYVFTWDREKARGRLRAADGSCEAAANLGAFDGFSTTIFEGLEVEFRAVQTADGLRATEIQPRTYRGS